MVASKNKIKYIQEFTKNNYKRLEIKFKVTDAEEMRIYDYLKSSSSANDIIKKALKEYFKNK